MIASSAITQCNNNVIMMSKGPCNVILTPWHYHCIMWLLGWGLSSIVRVLEKIDNALITYVYVIVYAPLCWSNVRPVMSRTWAQHRWTLQWRHNGRDGVSNHQSHDCLLNGLFRRRSKKTSKLRVTGLCEGNSPGTGEFPAQMASNAENSSI